MQISVLDCKFHLSRNPMHHRNFEIPDIIISSTPNVIGIRLQIAIVVIFLLFVADFYFLDAKLAREASIILIPNLFRMSFKH